MNDPTFPFIVPLSFVFILRPNYGCVYVSYASILMLDPTHNQQLLHFWYPYGGNPTGILVVVWIISSQPSTHSFIIIFQLSLIPRSLVLVGI